MSAIAERLGRELSRAASIDDEPRRDELVRAALDESLARLQAWPLAAEELQLASSLLWNPNAAWLDQGVLLTRARRKPLGYAGDYQLLRWIVERSVPGVTPLGQSLDRYFQTESAPRAVRERTRRVASDLAEQARRPGRPASLVERWERSGGGRVPGSQ